MKKNQSGSDAKALHGAILALIEGGGRGALTRTAEVAGMTTSAFRKRLLSSSPFDEPTMRMTLLISQSKAENHLDCPVIDSQTVGAFVIEVRATDNGNITTWRTKR